MVHRMLGEPGWTEKAAFKDLTQEYYKNAVYWAAENGIVSGYNAETFAPDRASAWAQAKPIPLPAPVTTATLSV